MPQPLSNDGHDGDEDAEIFLWAVFLFGPSNSNVRLIPILFIFHISIEIYCRR